MREERERREQEEANRRQEKKHFNCSVMNISRELELELELQNQIDVINDDLREFRGSQNMSALDDRSMLLNKVEKKLGKRQLSSGAGWMSFREMWKEIL